MWGFESSPGSDNWPPRLGVRTGDSHSSNRGSIPLGAILRQRDSLRRINNRDTMKQIPIMKQPDNNTVLLVLEDGVILPGRGFGAPALDLDDADAISRAVVARRHGGDVVFNTAMSGYHEIATDPSYRGQIVAMTYPMIGNYGCSDSWSEAGYASSPESIAIAGLVARQLYTGSLAPDAGADCVLSLHEFLQRGGVSGIYDVDTRFLTLRLRDRGELRGAIVRAPNGFERWDDLGDIPSRWRARCQAAVSRFASMRGCSLIDEAGITAPMTARGEGRASVALIDCGIKSNIAREIMRRDCKTFLFPSDVSAESIRTSGVDLVVFSNGPGDPAPLTKQIELARALIGKIPLFGICLGHQIIAQALGISTYKMRFGHHGANHPVRDEHTKRVFVTSQNHSFAVDSSSLRDGAEVWFRNANDGTIEGLIDRDRAIYTTQFHPEAAPGPRDVAWIFDFVVSAALKVSAAKSRISNPTAAGFSASEAQS